MSDEGAQGSIVTLPGAEHAVAALEVRERDAEGFAALRALGVSETGERFARLRHRMRLPFNASFEKCDLAVLLLDDPFHGRKDTLTPVQVAHERFSTWQPHFIRSLRLRTLSGKTLSVRS